MDNFNRSNQDQPGQRPPGKPARASGTGNLSMDSFQASKTGPLSLSNTTKRLSSGPLDPVKMLNDLEAEIQNGQLLLGKLQGRMVVLDRAVRIVDKPVDLPQILRGVGAGEADFTKKVAQLLQREPGTKRRVEVALYQYQQAEKGVASAADIAVRSGEFEGVAKAQFLETNAQVEKLRGQLYPLINLHMVFKDSPLLAQLIPSPPARQAPAAPAPSPVDAALEAPPQPAAPATGSTTERLKAISPDIAEDPHVQEVLETLNRVTGQLKNKLFGAFKKGG